MYIYIHVSIYLCIAEAVLMLVRGAGGEVMVSNRHTLEYKQICMYVYIYVYTQNLFCRKTVELGER